MPLLHECMSVVILTHNRAAELRRTLQQMLALQEQATLIVVDNGSQDHTREMLEREFPSVRLIALERNIGAAARNAGVQAAQTPYVAFCDDDTWWADGALAQATQLLDAHPSLAVLSARVLVGEQRREDPACTAMARSPLPSDSLPGPAILGFLAGACVMRRQAFLAAGGYEPRLFIGGEEALLTLDLVTNGWKIVYAPQLVVHHYPSPTRNASLRTQLLVRNALWVAWMRLPVLSALRGTWRICRAARMERTLGVSIVAALGGLPWVLKRRKVIPPDTALLYRMLER